MGGNRRGRELAGALRIRVPDADAYVSVRLTRRRPHHGGPSVLAGGVAWVVAARTIRRSRFRRTCRLPGGPGDPRPARTVPPEWPRTASGSPPGRTPQAEGPARRPAARGEPRSRNHRASRRPGRAGGRTADRAGSDSGSEPRPLPARAGGGGRSNVCRPSTGRSPSPSPEAGPVAVAVAAVEWDGVARIGEAGMHARAPAALATMPKGRVGSLRHGL
ncbi:NaeI family type II restriction endonuclease [Streptomyces somaliensis]|uniref:NaeI family type II restriction endonuclease n=1 Tax=Streptomyces somaliensis TaxID=78355 RepID=UPI003558057D